MVMSVRKALYAGARFSSEPGGRGGGDIGILRASKIVKVGGEAFKKTGHMEGIQAEMCDCMVVG